MDLDLLAVPVRQGASVNLADALWQYIEQSYGQNPSQFSQDIDTIAKSRDKAIASLRAFEFQDLAHYYLQLEQVLSKFPKELNAEFEWTSNLGYGTAAVKSSFLAFDSVNVLYDIGADLSHYAEDTSDLKLSYQSLQHAAWVFYDLSHNRLALLPTSPPRGLDKPTLEFLGKLCIAQAQEVFWAKQRVDNKLTHSLSAKIAAGAAQLYQEALNSANKTSVIKAEWAEHVELKVNQFQSIAHYRQSLVCLEKSQYGEQVGRLQEAMNLLDDCASKVQSARGISPSLISSLQGLRSRVASDLKNAEKENDLIYLQTVPRRTPLPAASITASASEPPFLRADSSQKSLFAMLLPFAVYQAPMAYQERLNNYVATYIVDPLDKLNHDTIEKLDELGLPSTLDVALEPEILPDSLLLEQESIVELGGLAKIEQNESENRGLADIASSRLAQLSNKFPKGSEKDETVKKFQKFLEQAVRSDQTVNKQIEESRYLITILCQGPRAISQYLPKAQTVAANKELESIAHSLVAIIQTLQALMMQRNDQIKLLSQKVHNMDLSTPMHAYVKNSQTEITQPSQLEPVYNSLVSQFDKDITDVKRQETELSKLLEELETQNKVFTRKLAELGQEQNPRTLAVKSLEQAASRCRQILSNLAEGTQFYNKFMIRISELEEEAVNQTSPGKWNPESGIRFS